MYKFVGLYLLIILGLFIEPDFLGSVGNILFKLVILSGASYLLYEIWNEMAPQDIEQDSVQTAPEQPKAVFEKTHAQLDHVIRNNDALKNYLDIQFTIFWDFTLPHNGYLIYTHTSGKTKVLQQRTNATLGPLRTNSFSPLISLLQENDSVLFENNLIEAQALFPFYNAEEYTPKSLLAFSTHLDEEQTLYWFYDADAENFFNHQEKNLFKQINQNTLYTLKETLQNKGLIEEYSEGQRLSDLANQLNKAADFEHCLQFFSDFLIGQFEASKFTIALREPEKESAEVKISIGLDDSTGRGYSFALSEGLHGWVILKNKPYLIDNIDKGEYFVPRFSRNEKTNFALRSLLSVPLVHQDEAFGMVSLEDKQENKYTENDKKRLIRFCEILGSAYARFLK